MSKASTASKHKQGHSFRIIGGHWRGRRLAFPEGTSVRPTGDRVRETLFNWLQAEVPRAKVLDLFAGSGALGLEALSRGAQSACFVERDGRLAKQLQANLALLGTTQATTASVVKADVLSWLSENQQHFDLVFLDPPYPQNLWADCFAKLATCLANNALVYTECPWTNNLDFIPPSFKQIKNSRAGQLRFMLLRYSL